LKDVHLPSALEQARFDDDIAVSNIQGLYYVCSDEKYRITIRISTKQ